MALDIGMRVADGYRDAGADRSGDKEEDICQGKDHCHQEKINFQETQKNHFQSEDERRRKLGSHCC